MALLCKEVWGGGVGGLRGVSCSWRCVEGTPSWNTYQEKYILILQLTGVMPALIHLRVNLLIPVICHFLNGIFPIPK